MEIKINDSFKIINDNSKLMLNYLKENSIDSIVCDPPYELGFMNKQWDGTGIAYDTEFWKQCLKVLKPGGYLLAFGGSRTYHRMAVAIEDAGFELRDTIMWLYGSGFPKSQNVGIMVDKKLGVESLDTGIKSENARPNGNQKTNLYHAGTVGKDFTIKQAQNEWAGYGTCLKPAFEPIIMARKPLESTVADNILKYGVGAINIDECRIDYGKETDSRIGTDAVNTSKCGFWSKDKNNGTTQMYKDNGRFPANVITDGSDEVAMGMPYTKSIGGNCTMSDFSKYKGSMMNVINLKEKPNRKESEYISPNDEGSAIRYFYCAKASKKDRDDGLDNFEDKLFVQSDGGNRALEKGQTEYLNKGNGIGLNKVKIRKNIHPTVKPTELMQYLVRLVSPKGATILDPFNGSGSTGKAVAFENRERQANYKYIGFELEKEYVDISVARIKYALDVYEYEAKKEEVETGQMRLF